MDYLWAIVNGAKDYLYGTFLAIEHPHVPTLVWMGEARSNNTEAAA